MEIDQAKEEEQDEATPEPSDDETDGEADEVMSSQTLRSGSVAKVTGKKEESKSDGKPPPKRELPFGRPATRKAPAKEPSPVEDDDDTEDEEL